MNVIHIRMNVIHIRRLDSGFVVTDVSPGTQKSGDKEEHAFSSAEDVLAFLDKELKKGNGAA